MESTQVSMRLGHDVWVRYSKDAEARGMALGTYLRMRLEEQDRFLAGELAALRAAVENVAASARAWRAESPAVEPSALVEALLLLRTLAGPQKAALVQKELERRGLAAWR